MIDKRMNQILWLIQGLFVLIGATEVLGAVGLILPRLVRIRQVLTPLAAAGLVIIMIGATVLTAAIVGVGPALLPLVVGLLAGLIAYGSSADLRSKVA